MTVFILDCHETVRRGVELLLRDAGVRVGGSSGSLREAAALLPRRRPQVVLLDPLGLFADPSDCERWLGEVGLPVVIYTGALAPWEVTWLLERGVRGVVSKASAPSRLCHALRCAAAEPYVDPALPAHALSQVRATTPRERQILQLLATGLTDQEVATELSLACTTVTTHVRNAVRRLGA